MGYLDGLSLRKISSTRQVTHSQVYKKIGKRLGELPHIADISRMYCNRYCGVLIADGKFIKVLGYKRKVPVLYGIDYTTHDIPTYYLARSESYTAWKMYFTSLRLLNYPLQVLVCDDNPNIREACKSVYPNVTVQLCQNHYKENIRKTLNARRENGNSRKVNKAIPDSLINFVDKEVNYLFGGSNRTAPKNLNNLKSRLRRLVIRYKSKDKELRVLMDLFNNSKYLFGYIKALEKTDYRVESIPRTTNLIELYNSHMEARLKSIKGFQNFKTANLWVNAYFLRRRTKEFTDCSKKFKYLNGRCSLEMTISRSLRVSLVLKKILKLLCL